MMKKLSSNLEVPANKVSGFAKATTTVFNTGLKLFAGRMILAVLIPLLLLVQLVSAQKADTSVSFLSNPKYDRYMQRHKTFNTVGWVLMAPGAALFIIGEVELSSGGGIIGLVLNSGAAKNGADLASAGIIMVLGSIPFFIIAKSNARKASLQLKSGNVPGAYKFNYIGLALKVNL
jgi:hypothetical protein